MFPKSLTGLFRSPPFSSVLFFFSWWLSFNFYRGRPTEERKQSVTKIVLFLKKKKKKHEKRCDLQNKHRGGKFATKLGRLHPATWWPPPYTPPHPPKFCNHRAPEWRDGKKTFTFIAGKAVKWWPISVGISQHWLKKETLPDRCRPDAIIRDKKKRKTNEDTMREENLVLKVRPTWHFIPFVWFMAVKALCCFAGFALLRSSVAHFGDFYFPFLFFVCVCVCVCGSAFLFVNPKLTSVVFWFHFIRTYCGRTSSSLDSKRISSSLWWKKNDN